MARQAGGIGLVFDVVDIVQASIDLSKKGRTEGSEQLIKTARCIEDSMELLKKDLERTTLAYSQIYHLPHVKLKLKRVKCYHTLGHLSTVVSELWDRTVLPATRHNHSRSWYSIYRLQTDEGLC